MASTPIGLPPLPPGYWDSHHPPLMGELDALLKLENEPDLFYQVSLVTRQAIHTVALVVFATIVSASSARERAWKDVKVSVQLTKAAWAFLHHFKSLLLIMADNYLKVAPLEEKNSKNLFSKFLPFLLEMQKHATSAEDTQALKSIEKSLKDHQSFLYDRRLVPVLCNEEVHFFDTHGMAHWENHVSIERKTFLEVSPAELPTLKIIEATVHPSEKDLYTDAAHDHKPGAILKVLNVAEQKGDQKLIEFAKRYSLEWNNRFNALARDITNDAQKADYQTQLTGHEADFKNLFEKFHRPYGLILLDSLPNIVQDSQLKEELNTVENRRIAIKKIVKNCPTYQDFQKAIENLVNLGLYEQFVRECPQAFAEIETLVANPSFLPRDKVYWIIKYHAAFHLNYLARQDRDPKDIIKERLVFLIQAAENHCMQRLATKILRKASLALDKISHSEDQKQLDAVRAARAERIHRLNRSLQAPISKV